MFEELRKFGLDRYDLPTMLDNVSVMLRMLTLNIDSRHNKRIPFIFYIITLVSLLCYIYAFQISVCWFILARDVEEKPLKKLMAFSQSVTTMVTVTKFLHMYWNKNELRKIIDAYLLCDSKVVPLSRMSKNMEKTMKPIKKRAVIYWLFVTSQVVGYVMVRPLVLDRNALLDYQVMWGLEPMIETPHFEISITVITLTSPITIFGPSYIVILLMVLAGYSGAHMLALTEELLYLWEDAEIDYRMQSSNKDSNHKTSIDEFVKHRLESIIKSHAQNQHMIQLIEDVFKNGLAFQFILLSLSLVVDLLGGLQDTYLQIPFPLILVGVDCFTGQKLLDASLAFEAAVYRCKWEKFDKDNMKLVLFMLQSAQKTMTLSAGGVAILSYSCFLSIIRRIYSAYAAIHSRDTKTEATRDIMF